MLTLLLLAQEGTSGTEGQAPQSGLMSFLMPMILIFGVFYFILIRPRQREQKQRKQMVEEMKKYDKIVTIGGVFGTIMEVRDQEIIVKVDDSSNTRMRFARSAIQRIIKSEESKEKD